MKKFFTKHFNRMFGFIAGVLTVFVLGITTLGGMTICVLGKMGQKQEKSEDDKT